MYIYGYDNIKSLLTNPMAKSYIDECKSFYEKNYKNKPIYSLSFSDYNYFFTHGDRARYEIPFFNRRKRLSVLQVLAIYDDKYIKDLEEIIWAICDEYTWVNPAHKKLNNKIDLFSAETARILAETVYVLDKKLSDLIKERVKDVLFEKIILAYENNTDWWDKIDCNWSAVCACGVGLTYLYLFPERYFTIEERLFNSFKAFLTEFDEEGYCYEGVGYWQYGFSGFCLFFDVYEQLKGVRPEFIDSEKVKKVIEYVNNARMSEDIYLPFADGGYPTWVMDANMAYTIKSLYPKDFKLNKLSPFFPCNKGLCLRSLVGIIRFGDEKQFIKKDESIYYKKAQVFIRKNKKYSFAVQCGNNGVIHNHNDVGAFQIVSNNERVICDFGAGKYTKEYFGTNEQRYKIFACNSLSHSVPKINGELQAYGKEYCGTILSCDKNRVTMDIAKAYKNGPKSLTVEYLTEEDYISIKYRCDSVKEKISFHFVSDLKPIKTKKGIKLGNTTIVSELKDPIIVSRKEEVNDPMRLERKTVKPRNVYTIDYEVLKKGEISAEFKIVF